MADAAGFAASSGAAAHVFAPALDDRVMISGDDGHHLQRVRRLRAGERVTVADGAGCWRVYDVVHSGAGALTLDASGPRRREPELEPGLAVAFALSKGTKPESVVSALTELGVDRIVAFRSARSVVRWDAARAAAAVARLQRVAREAAMQCRRARVPQVDPPVEVDVIATAPAVVLGDPAGMAPAAAPAPAGGEWLAVVGAEGGLDDEERGALLSAPGAVAVSVGPHVLRAETAAIALAAALTARRTPRIGHGG